MLREGEKGKFITLVHTMSNSPIIYLGNHKVYRNCVLGYSLHAGTCFNNSVNIGDGLTSLSFLQHVLLICNP